MWPTPILVYDIIVWLLTVVSHIFGYNVIVILGIVSTGMSAFILFKRFTTRIWLAVLGGLLFVFSPYMTSEIIAGHPDLFAISGILWLFLLEHELFVRQKWSTKKTGLLLALIILIQLVTSEELLMTSLLISLFGLIIWKLLNHKNDKVKLLHIYPCVQLGGGKPKSKSKPRLYLLIRHRGIYLCLYHQW